MILNNGDTRLVHSTKCTDGDIFRKFTWLGVLYSCFNAGVSNQFRRIQKFYKAEVEGFKSWNSYKTWHEITRLSAPAQISHILLKVWFGWSLLRAVWWTLHWIPVPLIPDGRILESYTAGPITLSRIFFSSALQQNFFSAAAVVTRDTWQLTRDTWHNPPFCRQSQGESRPEWQQSSKMWQTTGGRQGERRYYHNIRSWGAVVKVWGISNRMSKYFINKNNFSDMVLSSKTRTQNIN